MTTYISILRGINVSGQKLVKMEVLRKLYEDLGFSQITTYLQSGNVIFNFNDEDPGKLSRKIFDEIRNNIGFEVPVIVLTIDNLKQIIDNNPFTKDPNLNLSDLYVTFLASTPLKFDLQGIFDKRQNGEDCFLSNNAVYLYCPNGYGRTKLTNNFLESKLKVVATTRNWKTTNELLKLALDNKTL